MPIKVQCACGAAFAAKDELAGRTVKCPKCQQPLAIPAAGAAPAAAKAAPSSAARPAQPAAARPAQPAAGRPAQPAAARPAQPAAPRQVAAPLPSQAAVPQAAPAPHPGGDMFAEAGLHAQQAGMVPCPGCATPMPASAIICIKCGFNKKLGRRMDVIKQSGGAAIPGGHSVSVEEMMGRAAERIEEDKEEERKKTREGLPWWSYLIGLGVVMGFMITMMLLPQELVLRTAPFIIYGLAAIISLYAWVRILIIAFEEGVGHGIGCLVCGLYMLVYSFMRWDRCGMLFLAMFFSNFIANLAAFGIGFMLESMENPEDSRAFPDPHPAVLAVDTSWRPVILGKDGAIS